MLLVQRSSRVALPALCVAASMASTRWRAPSLAGQGVRRRDRPLRRHSATNWRRLMLASTTRRLSASTARCWSKRSMLVDRARRVLESVDVVVADERRRGRIAAARRRRIVAPARCTAFESPQATADAASTSRGVPRSERRSLPAPFVPWQTAAACKRYAFTCVVTIRTGWRTQLTPQPALASVERSGQT